MQNYLQFYITIMYNKKPNTRDRRKFGVLGLQKYLQMQNTEKIYTNPNLCGLWVESTLYPSAGAGQIQRLHPRQNACLMEHWQNPVVKNISLNGVYHFNHTLHLAQYLYMGHQGNTLYYVHEASAYSTQFEPFVGLATAQDFDEAVTPFSIRKIYLEARHLCGYSEPLTPEAKHLIYDRWLETGAFGAIMPYLAESLKSAVGNVPLVA
jgi:hypothetical protein